MKKQKFEFRKKINFDEIKDNTYFEKEHEKLCQNLGNLEKRSPNAEETRMERYEKRVLNNE